MWGALRTGLRWVWWAALQTKLVEEQHVLIEGRVRSREKLVAREDAVGAAHEHDALLEMAEGHAPRREAHLGRG